MALIQLFYTLTNRLFLAYNTTSGSRPKRPYLLMEKELREMKKLTFCFLPLLPLLFGCAPIQPSQSDIPAWDERMPLDSGSSETPSLSKRFSNIFSEGSNYHFRKVRWGFSRERVKLAEAGNTIFERKDNAIVYKVKLNGVYCRLIYTFKDNRLRTAGYMTITPIPHGDEHHQGSR